MKSIEFGKKFRRNMDMIPKSFIWQWVLINENKLVKDKFFGLYGVLAPLSTEMEVRHA